MNVAVAVPTATLVLSVFTISTSCSIALWLGHVPSYPQVSMCGIYPPERYVFSLGMTSVAFLLACLLVFNHIRMELLMAKASSQPSNAVFSGTMLGVGLSSCLSLALMATVSVGEMQMPHVLFAIAFFLLLVVFQLLNVAWRVRASSASGGFRIMEAWMVAWMISTFAGFVMWQQTGHAIPQYVAIASAMLHFSPYIWEMQDTALIVEVRGSEEEEEAARCLRDEFRVPDRHTRVREWPFVIAGGVMAVVVIGLGFVLSHLH